MSTYKIFENNDESFLANAETHTAIKVGVARDALWGPLWAFKGSVTLWLPFLLGTLLTLSPLYFYNYIEDAGLAQILGFTLWFIIAVFYFFKGNGLKVNHLKKNKLFKYLATVQGDSPEDAKVNYHNNKTKLLREEEKKRLQAAKELKAKEELDKVKQDTFGSSPVNQDIENAKERLINKEITVSQYLDIKKKIDEELKGQEKPIKVKESNENNDYIGQLEKAKKLVDDDNDEEFYLIATKEVEGSDRNEALWAKCMATQMGDDTKAKYCYVNKRVAILKQEAKDKAAYRKTLEEKIRQEIYVSIESNMSSTSDVPEYDLATDNLFPNSPNDHYRKKIISQFEEKVKERLEKEIN